MADRQMWFGNVKHAQWVPMPRTGMTVAMENGSEELALDNGGLWIDDSSSEHAVYTMDFGIADKGYEGIEAFMRFKAGEWGTADIYGRDGYLRFVDPMRSHDNLFNRVWGSPGIAEKSDWKGIGDIAPTFVDVAANAYQQPLRAAVFSIQLAANAVPITANSVFTLLIPPTHTLWLGATGSVSGPGVLRVDRVKLDGTLDTPVDITLTADATLPNVGQSFSGATYKAIRVYMTRTAATTTAITLASLRAQAWKTGVTPPVLTRHIPGLGHAGLKMRGTSRVDTYLSAVRRQIQSGSIVLGEVEPWQP